MTSKLRIIFGFGILALMTVILSFFSYFASRQTLTDLEQFVKSDKADSLTFQIEIQMSKINEHLELYISENKSVDKQLVIEHADKVISLYRDLLAVTPKESVSRVQEALGTMQSYKSVLTEIVNDTGEFYNVYNNRFLPALGGFKDVVKEISDVSYLAHDIVVFKTSMEMQNEITVLLENMLSFLLSQQKAYLTPIEQSMKNIQVEMDEIKVLEFNEDTKALYQRLLVNYEEAAKSVASLQTIAKAILHDHSILPEKQQTVVTSTALVSKQAHDNASKTLNGVVEKNKDASSQNLIFSIICVLLSIVIAGFICISLAKTLNKLALSAQNIARGVFDQKIDIKEKGEIGQIVAGMDEIAKEFSLLIASCRETANNISSGSLAARMNEKDFDGGYKNLAEAINIVANCYTKYIEFLPTGVFTARPDNTVVYMNETAKKMIGQSAVEGRRCAELFKANTCGDKSTCLGCRSITKNGPIIDIAKCQNGDTTLTLDVFAIPINDLDGKVVGYLEIITDMTPMVAQTEAIKAISDHASGVAMRVASAAEELSAQTDNLVHGASLQKERVENTSAAMTQMNSSVVEIARSASITAEQSHSVRSKAQEGIVTLGKMTESMTSLTNSSENLKANMAQLDELAEGIDSVINVISDIADQTNLLALNAAIEAARAGEAGRGFAVVADEVRKLAEKTMTATSEVDDSIRAIQNSSRLNQDEVTNVVSYVSRTAQLAQESENSLQEIVSFTGQTSEMIQNISTAAQEQKNVSNEISQSMLDISDTVMMTSEAIGQSAEAIRELTLQAQDLQSAIGKVNN